MAKEIPDDMTFGEIWEEPDERDYTLDMIIKRPPEVPEEFWYEYPYPIKNQGGVGSCVAQTLTSIREVNYHRKGEEKLFSPGFTYACRVEVNTNHMGPGMVAGAAVKEMGKVGAVLQDDFPWYEEMPDLYYNHFEPNKAELIEKAGEYRIAEPYGVYARLRSLDEIFDALYVLGPTTISMVMFREYEDPPWSENDYRMTPPVEGTARGRHMMTVLGWKKDAFIVKNSWGDWWKDGGYFYVPFHFWNERALNMTSYALRETWFGEEDEDLKDLVIVYGDADYPYAKRLAERLGCPLVSGETAKNKEFSAETAYIAGGNDKYLDELILTGFGEVKDLRGERLFETVEKVKRVIDKI